MVVVLCDYLHTAVNNPRGYRVLRILREGIRQADRKEQEKA